MATVEEVIAEEATAAAATEVGWTAVKVAGLAAVKAMEEAATAAGSVAAARAAGLVAAARAVAATEAARAKVVTEAATKAAGLATVRVVEAMEVAATAAGSVAATRQR